MTPIHLGVSLSQGNATWDEVREGARLCESLGYDSIWSPDHFLTSGDGAGPYLEAWQVMAAWAGLTSRVRLGPLVTPIDFRHPAVLAKMAATLDHVSGGRAILGLGAGWYEQEYRHFGLPFGPPGERLRRLAETAMICRALFDQKSTTFQGHYYQLKNARAEPKPLQRRLPILIGAGGEHALRVVARHADWWNAFGAPDVFGAKLDALGREMKAAGRAPDEIVPSLTIRPLIVRDTRAEIDDQVRLVAERHRLAQPDTDYMVAGSVDEVATRLREYVRMGVRTFIVQQRVPWDRESLRRLSGEVRRLLD